MRTEIVPCTVLDSTPGLALQYKMRNTPLDKWLTTHELADRLSGTLRKGSKIGFLSRELLKSEAIAQTMGWGFESVPGSYITFNDAILEGDCHPLTEAGWHVDRMLHTHIWPEDHFELKYINVQGEHGNVTRQGVGIIVRKTGIQWIPGGHILFAMLTEYCPVKKTWTECVNPF